MTAGSFRRLPTVRVGLCECKKLLPRGTACLLLWEIWSNGRYGLYTIVIRAPKLSPTIPTVSFTVAVYPGQWVPEVSRSHVCMSDFSNVNQGPQEMVELYKQSSGTIPFNQQIVNKIRWEIKPIHLSCKSERTVSYTDRAIMPEGSCRKYTLGPAGIDWTDIWQPTPQCAENAPSHSVASLNSGQDNTSCSLSTRSENLARRSATAAIAARSAEAPTAPAWSSPTAPSNMSRARPNNTASLPMPATPLRLSSVPIVASLCGAKQLAIRFVPRPVVSFLSYPFPLRFADREQGLIVVKVWCRCGRWRRCRVLTGYRRKAPWMRFWNLSGRWSSTPTGGSTGWLKSPAQNSRVKHLDADKGSVEAGSIV